MQEKKYKVFISDGVAMLRFKQPYQHACSDQKHKAPTIMLQQVTSNGEKEELSRPGKSTNTLNVVL